LVRSELLTRDTTMSTQPMEYIWPGIIAAQAIYAAAKLRIPDLLASGPKNVAELASDSGAQPAALERLLRALSTLDMFARAPDGRFSNTPLTDVLRTDHPQSQRDAALFLPAAFLWRPLGELYESVRTGERSAMPPCFCPPLFFGARWESFMSRFAPGSLHLSESSGNASSTTSPPIRMRLRSSTPS